MNIFNVFQGRWYKHFCFLNMGNHFFEYDYTPDQVRDIFDSSISYSISWSNEKHINDSNILYKP